MRNWKFGKAALLAAALALTASLSVGSALAYFTAYCTAKGGVPVNMGFTDTEIREEVIDDAKHVWIKNTGDYDCFIRVKVFAPDEIMNLITYTEPEGTDNWSGAPNADGYLYYTHNTVPCQGGKSKTRDGRKEGRRRREPAAQVPAPPRAGARYINEKSAQNLGAKKDLRAIPQVSLVWVRRFELPAS